MSVNNAFLKKLGLAFTEVAQGFEELLSMSDQVKVTTRATAEDMQRSNSTIWIPQPYILDSVSSLNISGMTGDIVKRAVPISINREETVYWDETPLDLIDMLDTDQLKDAAIQKLSSRVNQSMADVICNTGSIVVSRPGAASGFEDFAEIDTAMTSQGVNGQARTIGLSPRDFNSAAASPAGRQTLDGVALRAYESGILKTVAGFDLVKMDTVRRLQAATTATVTINGANQYHIPKASTHDESTGADLPFDNRFQIINITVAAGGSVKVGDAFELPLVNAVNHMNKEDTGERKTFRITKLVTGNGGSGAVQITPPIISGQGGTRGEKQYKNVTQTPADGAELFFLNRVTAYANPFWAKNSIELTPGKIGTIDGAGLKIYRATTKQGLEIVGAINEDIDDLNARFRLSIRWGMNNTNPEMNGIQIFNQGA